MATHTKRITGGTSLVTRFLQCERSKLLRHLRTRENEMKGFFNSDFGLALLAFAAIMMSAFIGTLIAGAVLIAVAR